jgi:hypothetical protein
MPIKSTELLDRLGVASSMRGWEQCTMTKEVDVGAIVEGLKAGKRAGHLFPPVK